MGVSFSVFLHILRFSVRRFLSTACKCWLGLIGFLSSILKHFGIEEVEGGRGRGRGLWRWRRRLQQSRMVVKELRRWWLAKPGARKQWRRMWSRRTMRLLTGWRRQHHSTSIPGEPVMLMLLLLLLLVLLLLEGSHGRQMRMVGMLMMRRVRGIPRRNLNSTTAPIAGHRWRR